MTNKVPIFPNQYFFPSNYIGLVPSDRIGPSVCPWGMPKSKKNTTIGSLNFGRPHLEIEYQDNLKTISRDSQDNLKTISRQSQDNLKIISRDSQDNLKTISRDSSLPVAS